MPFRDNADVLQAEFKDLGFGYIEAVSVRPDIPMRANPLASLLPSRKMDGAVV
jgi:hypothetical protein